MTQEERIKYKDNIERINNMTLGMIYKMSTYNLCRLTDDFADPLVRMIFAKTVNIDEQRKLVKFLDSAFIECGFFINDNETYFDDLSYEIDCNRIITEDGTARPPVMVTVPPSSTKETANPSWLASRVKAAKEASTNIETPPFETTKKELEDEIKKLKSVIKELKEKHPSADNHDEIDVLKEEIAYLKEKDGKLTSKEAAILTITACYHAGGLPPNRENLHPILMNLFGVGETLAKRRLREGINKNDVEELAKCFDGVSPVIARTLREIPEKLKNKKKK